VTLNVPLESFWLQVEHGVATSAPPDASSSSVATVGTSDPGMKARMAEVLTRRACVKVTERSMKRTVFSAVQLAADRLRAGA
jgi:hypothetical protein